MADYEPCSICEEYIEGVICDKDKCPVGIMKKELDRLHKLQNPTKKAEAIKEFAERVKPMMFGYYDCLKESAEGRPYKGDTLMDYEVVDMIEDCIDNLVKEMVGG